jgi:hypothetical protein
MPGDDDFADDSAGVFGACLAWAERTAGGNMPGSWTSPTSPFLDERISKNDLTLVHGRFRRQVTLHRASDRLALSLPVLSSWPADLPESLRLGLAALLDDARARWPLVRLGAPDGNLARGLRAEVDLTGAPAGVLECLLSASLAGLRRTVTGLVETVELLADAAVASGILATFSELTPQLRKENTNDRND